MTDDNNAAPLSPESAEKPGQAPVVSQELENTGSETSADAAALAGAAVPGLDQPVPDLFRTREALCEAADRAATGVAEPLQQSVFLYYLARYLVSVYEARYTELPIQVWNEYRNALDHFMRHVSATGCDVATDGSHHLRRMEGHVQRAVLDVTKMLCVQCHDAINQDVEHWGPEVLDLIDGGNFRSEVRQVQQEAIGLLEHAKTNDAQLGQYTWLNREVIERYLDAFYTFDRVLRAFTEKHLTLANAKRQWETLAARNNQLREQAIAAAQAEIRPVAIRRAVYVGLVTGVPMALLGAVVGWWLSYRYPAPIPPLTTPVVTTSPATANPISTPPLASVVVPETTAPGSTIPAPDATPTSSATAQKGPGQATSTHP